MLSKVLGVAEQKLQARPKTYREIYDVDHRISESNRILAKYPEHVPIIVETDKSIGKLNKHKFLVPSCVSASYLLCSVRKQCRDLKDSEALFLFYDNILVCPTALICDVYQKYIDHRIANKKKIGEKEVNDKFFYVYLTKESTFGC